MSFWRFLKDQKLVAAGWLLFVLLTIFVIWLSPGLPLDWGTVGYLALIEGVLLIVLLVYHYFSRRVWWQKLALHKEQSAMQNYLTGARREDEQLQQEYINQVIREHQSMMQEIVAGQEEQKDYIDSWVHEIKVPLAASQLLLRSLEFDIPDDKYMMLENELGKIDGYVEQVLYFSRLDNFSKDYLIKDTSLKEVLLPVLRSNANYFIQRKIRYEVLGEDQSVLTDGKWLGFILQQLVSNAIKYTPSEGKITLIIEKKAKGVQLSVKDTGIGIPSEDLGRIFDKGFTGQNGRFSETHATGLGLYLARNLANQLGLELTAKSVVGAGTTMSLYFPYLAFYQEQK
ncbi:MULTISPECIES: two-component system sensor histidine kinase SapS [Enterococcus]|uniref:histidine kinase n=1 Tax=Enterococcus diestrammenae TaxID=1155073 RepID=A0ABV0EZ41_9ENTE|nr:sensor histidine kinase [Enterococcus diestrammenae]KAF1294878.1 histidine kinase [Enterococcus diestrammenae]HIX70535.1 sensor histidine kinase [Candidatus Enterococcus stercoravium]